MPKPTGAIGQSGSKVTGGSSIGTTAAGKRTPNYSTKGSSEAPF